MTKQKIRESLNKLDVIALDNCEKYYDLVNLYEAMESDLNPDELDQLFKLIEKKNSKQIHDLLSSALYEDFDSGEQVIDEEFTDFDDLDESRNTLRPVKCKALASHKTYWSPYDTKEGDFAKFGIRFRYDNKQACQDAINDPDKGLGYDKDSKKGHTKVQGDEEVVEEALNNGDSGQVDPVVAKSVEELITNPLKPSTGAAITAWIAIKLYQLTNKGTDLSKGITRKELNRLTGTPPERLNIDSQNNTSYMHLSNGWTKNKGKPDEEVIEGEGLIRCENGLVYATEKLKPWVEGSNSFPNGKHDIDFRMFIGGPKDPENKLPRKYQTNTSLKSPYGRGEKDEEDRPSNKKKNSFVKAAPSVKPEEPVKQEEPVQEKEPEVMPTFEFDDTMFEGVEMGFKEFKLDENFDEREKFRKAYRQYMQLDEDADIEDNFDDYSFKSMCANHGWTFDRTRRIMLGK